MLENGDVAGATRILNQRWVSLPGGSQATQRPERYEEWRRMTSPQQGTPDPAKPGRQQSAPTATPQPQAVPPTGTPTLLPPLGKGQRYVATPSVPYEEIPETSRSKDYFSRRGITPNQVKGDVRRIQTPYGPINVHKDAVADFTGFYRDLKALGAPIDKLGSYNVRRKAYGSGWSAHAFATATDFNDAAHINSPALRKWLDEHREEFVNLQRKWNIYQSTPGDEPHLEWYGPHGSYLDDKGNPVSGTGAAASGKPSQQRGAIPSGAMPRPKPDTLAFTPDAPTGKPLGDTKLPDWVTSPSAWHVPETRFQGQPSPNQAGGASPEDLSYLGSHGAHNTIRSQNVGPEVTGGVLPPTNREFAARLRAAGEAYKKETGQEPRYGEMTRDKATQQVYWDRYVRSGYNRNYIAARPGRSNHQPGNAADVPHGPFLDWLHNNGSRFGLDFPVLRKTGKDPVHTEMDPRYKGPNFYKPTTKPSQLDANKAFEGPHNPIPYTAESQRAREESHNERIRTLNPIHRLRVNDTHLDNAYIKWHRHPSSNQTGLDEHINKDDKPPTGIESDATGGGRIESPA
jgi:hypothetical protein